MLASWLLDMKLKLKKEKRPKWSIKTNFFGSIFVVALVSSVVLLFLKKSIWVELEIISIILFFCIFIYLFYVLYHGIRFDNNEKYAFTWKRVDDVTQLSPVVDTGGALTGAGAEAGILGLIIGFLLDIIVSILLSILIAAILWFGINIVLSAILILFFPLFYLFRRSIRFVVAKGRRCHKNIEKSLLFAFQATVTNTLWLYVIIACGHYISKLINS
jgi:hypothetical protein